LIPIFSLLEKIAGQPTLLSDSIESSKNLPFKREVFVLFIYSYLGFEFGMEYKASYLRAYLQ